MRVLATGDWHYRASRPVSRKDDYIAVQRDKIKQIYTIAEEFGCRFILQPGDMFDGAEPPLWLVRDTIRNHPHIDHNHSLRLLSVFGQHDQRYHSNKVENTPMAVLEAAGVLEVLGKGAIGDGNVRFYGCSWDPDIPTIYEPDKVNILVMHRMVIGDKKLWEAQEGYDWGRVILRRNKFDLIVCGDNHQFFTDSIPGNRHLVNCGSLMRANIDQDGHEPAVVVYDTVAQTIKTVKLDVAPASEVFDLGAVEAEKTRNAELDAFIEQIGQTSGAPDLDFLGNLSKLARATGVPKTVTALVDRIVEESHA